MGYFSWFTQDESHKRIVIGEQLKNPVYMVGVINGKTISFSETNYKGYGKFGGKDYYEFMAEMNGKTVEDFGGDRDKLRSAGIKMAFDRDPMGYSVKWKHPSLSTIMGDYHNGDAPESDPDQGIEYW